MMRAVFFLLLVLVSCSPLPAQVTTGDVLMTEKSATGKLVEKWITKTPNKVIGWNGSGVLGPVDGGGGGGGSGTVTSVALSLPGVFSVTGSPVTTTGALTAALASQSANRVWAGPATGSAAAPTFRALVAEDVPDLSGVYQPLNAKLTTLSAGFGGIYVSPGLVRWNGTSYELLGRAVVAGEGGTGFNTYSAGDILFGSVSDATQLSKLAGNTTATKRFLTQTGDGTSSAAPAWGTIQAADVPTLNQNTTGTAAGLSATLAVASGGTGITSFGTGIATWLGTPTKANLSAAISDDDPAFIGSAQTFSQAQTFSSNGAASTPALALTGTPFTGGSATTTKPLFSIETSGATSTGWSTSGTMLGVNAASGFAGNLVDIQKNGVSRLNIPNTGYVNFTTPTTTNSGLFLTTNGWANGHSVGITFGDTTLFNAIICPFAAPMSVNHYYGVTTVGISPGGKLGFNTASANSIAFGTSADALLIRKAAASFGFGIASATPITQTFGGADGSGTNITGGTLNIGTQGTGTGTGGVINFQSHAAGSSGSTLGTLATIASVGPTGFTIGNSGTAIAQIKRYSLTMVAGTVTQASTSVTANSTFIIDRRTVGGTVGDISTSVSAGSSFTLNSTSIIETSTFTVTEIIFP